MRSSSEPIRWRPDPGRGVTILEKEGRLVQRVDGFPDVALILLKGNRYKPEGFPDGFITSFRVKGGKADLLWKCRLVRRRFVRDRNLYPSTSASLDGGNPKVNDCCGPCWSYGLDSAKSPASMIVSLAGST